MSELTTFVRKVRRLDLALRVLAVLGDSSATSSVNLSGILERVPGSVKFTQAVLASLRADGIITSTRGSHGGYRLAMPLDRLSLLRVLDAIAPEGAEVPDLEVLGGLWRSMAERTRSELASLTVDEVIRSRAAGR